MEQKKTKRIIAFIIDQVIYTLLTSVLLSLANISIGREISRHTVAGHDIIFCIEGTIIGAFAYFVLFDIVNNGVSIGKEIEKIRVLKKDTNLEPALGDRLKRTLLKMFSLLVLPVAIIIFLINGQTLQDHFSKTKTV